MWFLFEFGTDDMDDHSEHGWFGGVISRIDTAHRIGGRTTTVAYVDWDAGDTDPEWVELRDGPYWHGTRLGSWKIE